MFIKRGFAFLIDVMVGFGVAILSGVVANYTVSRGVFLIFILLSLLGVHYIFYKDMWNGRSIGKRIVGLKVISSVGTATTKWQLFCRNISYYAFPVEAILLLCNQERMGDRLAKTVVVEWG